MNVTAWVVVLVSFGLASQLIVRITTAATPAHIPKGAAQTLSTYLVIAGLGGSALAVTAFVSQPSVGMAVAGVLGLAAAALAGRYLHQISRPNDTLIRAFGPGWDTCIPADRATAMLRRRWRWALPSGAKPRWDRDIVYWKLPDTDRELLADLWQPPAGVARSGLGFVYLHAGYYQMLDKDRGTRPLFSHLARQGHVVMDVSYRLLDETDIFGMLDDVKRGIAWMKDNAATYRIDPQRIVVAGNSAGGNLALLAGYTPGHPLLTNDHVVADTSVRAVVAYYGVHDWPEFYQLSGDQDLAHRLLGGSPKQVPDRYELASPVYHVGAATPTTLLVQGLHDQRHLIDAGRKLHRYLAEAGVRVANVELPGTDHAFDLILGRISPPGIAALYDLERFLARLAYEPA